MDDLDLIKSKINIIDLIQEYVPLKKLGRNFKGLCPFHNEKTPSFVVSPERQIWHCFGCQLGGDIFGFLMKIENIEFPEALRILAKRAGVTLQSYKPTGDSQLKERLYEINHLAAEFYHYILLNRDFSKPALEYLKKREVTKSTLELFKIGYAPPMWRSVSEYLVNKKGYKQQELEQAGLSIHSGNYYDRFRGRIIFPLRDHRGNVIGFSGRLLDADAKEAKYVNSPETLIYSKSNHLFGIDLAKDHLKKENKAILVEGEFDMISSYQAGVKNIVAIKGSALTEGHITLLKRFTQNLIFSLDSDFAGNAAAKRGIELADAAGMNMRVVKLAYGKDPDECLKKDPALWRQSLKNAVPIYDYLIDGAVEKFDKKSPEGKRNIAEEVLPLLSKVTNEIVKSHYVKKLAQILEVTESSVLSQMGKVKIREEVSRFKPVLPASPSPAIRSREEKLEELLLASLLQADNPAPVFAKIKDYLSPDDLKTPLLNKIFRHLAASLDGNENPSSASLINSLPAELLSAVDRLFLIDLQDSSKGDKTLEKIASQIAVSNLKEKMQQALEKISTLDGESAEAMDLNREFSLLRDRLKTLQES